MFNYVLLIIGLILTDGTCTMASSTCTDMEVPYLLLRDPSNTMTGTEDDQNLPMDWYKTNNYFILSDAEPEVGDCGTIFPIYLQDTHPSYGDLTDSPITVSTCIKDYVIPCIKGPDVQIKVCNGNVEYYLSPTDTVSLYCFAPTSDLSFFVLDIDIGSITLRPELRHELQGSQFEFYQPFLDFICDFNEITGSDYKYMAEWWVNGQLFVTHGPTKNISDLILSEEDLVQNSIRLGMQVQCGIVVSDNSARSEIVYSQNFYAGIEMETQHVILRKDDAYELKFTLSVPIGCFRPANLNLPYNKHATLSMYDRTLTCDTGGTVANNPQARCGANILCTSITDTWDPTMVYSVTLVAKTVNTKDLTTYTLDFLLRSTEHEIWKEYQPPNVMVDVPRDAPQFEQKRCYIHADPHHKTADGKYYDHHRSGYFILYKNTKYGIEVQVRTTKCCNWCYVTCVCAIAVRAGGDVFVVDRCNLRGLYAFKQCDDNGILKVIETSTWSLRIETPIGTYITINSFRSWFRGPKTWLLNVSVFMAPKDYGNTEGLCGTFDGTTSNDFTVRDSGGMITSSPHVFAESYRTKDGENLFLIDTPSERWEQFNGLFCYCDHEHANLTDEVVCDSTLYPNCNANPAEVTATYCRKVTGRRRRSERMFIEEYETRLNMSPTSKQNKIIMKRDTSTNITEAEALNYCNQTIHDSVTANFPQILSYEEIVAKVNECASDVETLQDLTAGYLHIEALSNIVKVELDKDPEYAESHQNEVLYFITNSCENNCSGNGVCSSNACHNCSCSSNIAYLQLWTGCRDNVEEDNDDVMRIKLTTVAICCEVIGACVCESGYSASDCSIGITQNLTIHYVTAFGLCDVSYQPDCRCFDVATEDLLENFKCRTEEHVIDVVEGWHSEDPEDFDGSYLNVFEGECCIPSSRRDLSSVTGGFYTRYFLSISNDGTNYGDSVPIYVYDSTCQEKVTNANGQVSFDIKDAYCFINGMCVAEHQTKLDDPCSVCDRTVTRLDWTHVCTNSRNEDNSNKYTIATVAVCIVIVIAVVLTVTILIKKKILCCRQNTTRSTSPQPDPTHGKQMAVYPDKCLVLNGEIFRANSQTNISLECGPARPVFNVGNKDGIFPRTGSVNIGYLGSIPDSGTMKSSHNDMSSMFETESRPESPGAMTKRQSNLASTFEAESRPDSPGTMTKSYSAIQPDPDFIPIGRPTKIAPTLQVFQILKRKKKDKKRRKTEKETPQHLRLIDMSSMFETKSRSVISGGKRIHPD